MARSVICFFTIVLVFTLVSADSVKPSNKLEEEVLLLLTKWREGAVQTNLFKLPSIKNIEIDGVESYYNANGIKVTFTVGKMQLSGLDTFSLETLKVTQTDKELEMTGRVNVRSLTLSADNYSLKGSAYYFYPIRGSGHMTIQFKDVDILVNVRFINVDDVSTRLDHFALDFNITKIKANLEKSSFLINQVINAEGATMLKGHQKDIENDFKRYAVPYVNRYLEKVSLLDFVKTILDVSGSAEVIKNEEMEQHKVTTASPSKVNTRPVTHKQVSKKP